MEHAEQIAERLTMQHAKEQHQRASQRQLDALRKVADELHAEVENKEAAEIARDTAELQKFVDIASERKPARKFDPLTIPCDNPNCGCQPVGEFRPVSQAERAIISDIVNGTTTAPTPAAPPIPNLEIRRTKYSRNELDTCLQRLKSFTSSRERALAITKLQEAIMWLGMDLKERGTPTPYPASYDPSSSVVHPVADGLTL